MIIINDNDYINPCDKSNDIKKNKRMNNRNITLRVTCVVILETIKILRIIIMIIKVTVIVNNSNL